MILLDWIGDGEWFVRGNWVVHFLMHMHILDYRLLQCFISSLFSIESIPFHLEHSFRAPSFPNPAMLMSMAWNPH